jgi:hypothetical protein
LNKYKHLISFDLSSYGTALSILNQFADGDNIKDFEVSLSGTSAQLILLSQDMVSLQVLKGEAQSLFKSQILDVQIIENIHADLLPTYLSQNKPQILNSMAVLEGVFVSTGLMLLQQALVNNIYVVEFRVVRTFPKNVILVLTSQNTESFSKISSVNFKLSQISNVEKTLKSYFEI